MQNKIRPTKAEERRFINMHDRGCVACWLESDMRNRDYIVEPGDVHHVEQANACGNHLMTYINCPWHHRGVCKLNVSEALMRSAFGPSMAKEPLQYRQRYGDEYTMLDYQATLLLKSPAEFEKGI